MTLDQINHVDAADFVAALGGIFEHSPWVAEAVLPARPFIDLSALHRAMCQAVQDAPAERQLALIRAHPQLASKAAVAGELTAASQSEQSGAGLLHCSAEEYARLRQLNDDYQQRFGFPFILAVRGHDRSSILAELARRLQRDPASERAAALAQIERIAAFRLADLLGQPLASPSN
ncbi:MAG: 2-oxo-4-hydroxy-4-carboxy-5-ureidoimidazoline decarboxylase [Xanthomonadales bacterium]|nr:2-oxo-4-hydroxy-4-carboxy-5-ureidoimidazoline decarboxylase [Xanthomonadales bacterium]